MKRRPPGGAIALALIATAAALAWLLRSGESRAPPTNDRAKRLERTEAHEITPTPGRVPRSSGNLRIVVEGAKAGRIYWVHTQGPPRALSQLAPEQRQPLPDGAGTLLHRGEASLTVPPGRWTWLRVTGPSGRSAYRRVAPFAGTRELRLRLPSRGIHAIVWTSDFRRLAASAHVRLLATDLRGGGPPVPLATAQTDCHGYVFFRDLDPRGYLVAAGDAAARDGAPAVQRIVLPAAMPATEVPTTLVVPDTAHPVTLEVDAHVQERRAKVVKLFLREVGGKGGLYPATGSLGPGKRRLTVRVPAGLYRVDGLPLLELSMHATPSPLEVPVDRTAHVKLHQRPHDVELTLAGISVQSCPLTVSVVRDGDFVGGREEALLFVGRYRWRRPTQTVPSMAAPAWVTASNLTACWISERPVVFTGAAASAPMRQGARIEIRWRPPARPKDPLVELESKERQALVLLRPRLVMVRGAFEPRWTGEAIVHPGPLRLRCTTHGGEAWTRNVHVDKARLLVVVDR